MDRSKWEYKKLGELCDKGSSNIAQNKIENITGKYPLYGASGYVKGIDFYHQEKPYIGIVKDGSGVGRTNLYPAKSSLLGTMQYIIPKDGCEIGFLLYVIKGLHLENYKTGAAIPHIYFKDYGKSIVPFPPLADQQRIVAELDCLNEMIALKQEQLNEFDKLAQSIFYDMFGDPAINDKKWDVFKLGELCTKISDGVHAKPTYVDKGMPFISVVNINKGCLTFENCKYVSEKEGVVINKRSKPERGDVLYTKVGATYGIPALVDTDIDFCLYVSVCLIKPKHEIIDSVFLTRLMGLPYIKHQADERIKGIGVPDLHLNQISAFNIPLPPLALQQQFAEKIQAIEAQKELVKKSIAETQQLLDSRMDYYFD